LESQEKYEYQEDWKIKENKNTKRTGSQGKLEYQEDWKVKENKNTKRIGK
jgi:hypothetical protein